MISAPSGAPRSSEASIGAVTRARSDGLADWYESTLLGDPLVPDTALWLLGAGPGRLLDVGCGTGFHTVRFVEAGWSVVGIDPSDDQLRRARERGLEVISGRGEELPFGDGDFDAAVSLWTHTDVDDFAAVCREIARVLKHGSPLVYVGAHPCFVGPHSRFTAAEGSPVLHPGYRRTGRYSEGPGVRPDGLRVKVGATHLPLGLFVESFLDAGFALEAFREGSEREYPHVVAMRWRR